MWNSAKRISSTVEPVREVFLPLLTFCWVEFDCFRVNETYNGWQCHPHLGKVVKESVRFSTFVAELTFGLNTFELSEGEAFDF